MTTHNAPHADPSTTTILIQRTFQAPRERLFSAWTDPQQVEAWWGPEGFSTTVAQLDLRPGGTSRYVMHGPDGTDYPCKGVFREIDAPHRIVTTDEFDEGFEVPDATELPTGIMLTATFDETKPDETTLTLHIDHPTPEDRRKHEEMGVVAGWNSSFNCLDRYLAQS